MNNFGAGNDEVTWILKIWKLLVENGNSKISKDAHIFRFESF